MRGGRENKDIRDNTDRTSEFDSENYVKPIRKQGDNDMAAVVFQKEGGADRRELDLKQEAQVKSYQQKQSMNYRTGLAMGVIGLCRS